MYGLPRAIEALVALTLFLGPHGPQYLIISFGDNNFVRSQTQLEPNDCYELAAQMNEDYFGTPQPQPQHGVEAVFCIDAAN